MKRYLSLFFCWLIACLPMMAAGDTGMGWRQSGIQAPNDANYIVTSLSDQLSNERVLDSGTYFLEFNDNGANGSLELVIASDLAVADGGTGSSTAAGALINLIGTPTKGKILIGDGSVWNVLDIGADGKVLIADGSQPLGARWGDSASTLDDEQYLVLSATGDLTNERVFTAGTGISVSDGGAGAAYTVSINTSVVATLTGSQTLSNKTLSNPIIDSQLTIEKGANDYTVTFSTPAAARIINFPDPGATADVVYTASAQTIAGVKTFSSAPVFSTGTVTVSGNTITIPAATDTVTLIAASQTLTNKTLTSPIFGTQATLTQSSGNYTITWNNPAAGRAYKIEDIGGGGAFAMKGDGSAYTNGGVAYGDGNKLVFGSGGTDGQWLKKTSGVPTWTDFPGGGLLLASNITATARTLPTSGALSGTYIHFGNWTSTGALTFAHGTRIYIKGNVSLGHNLVGTAQTNGGTADTYTGPGGRGGGLSGGGNGGYQYGGGGGGGNAGAGGRGAFTSTANIYGDSTGGRAVVVWGTGGSGGGCGGGSGTSGQPGQDGGGGGAAILWEVDGTFTQTAGTFSALGANGSVATTTGGAGGGGAGGDIDIAATGAINQSGGTISVVGGNGGNYTSSGVKGGGGGGGKSRLRSGSTVTVSGTHTAAGGSKGTGTDSTVAATDGSAGTTEVIQNTAPISLWMLNTVPLRPIDNVIKFEKRLKKCG